VLERILQALRSHYPGKPSGFEVRILGKGDLWITEYTIQYHGRLAYTVHMVEFRNGKVVHMTRDRFPSNVRRHVLLNLWVVARVFKGSDAIDGWR